MRTFARGLLLGALLGSIAGASMVEWQNHKNGEDVVLTATPISIEVTPQSYSRLELFATAEESVQWKVTGRTYRGAERAEFFPTGLQVYALPRVEAETSMVDRIPAKKHRLLLEIKDGRLVTRN